MSKTQTTVADDLDATIVDPDPPSRHWNVFRNVPVEPHPLQDDILIFLNCIVYTLK